MPDSLFKLSQKLEPNALAKNFARDGRIHIPDILEKKSAQTLFETISKDTPWNLVFNEGEKHYDLSPQQVSAMTDQQRSDIRNIVLSKAREGFQYLYNNFPLYDSILNGTLQNKTLQQLHDFINSEVFLSFIRAVTGFDDIRFADSQVTAYGPGHFLTTHDDDVEGKNRRVAYVINMTPNWRQDWGGYLQFFDKNGHVVQAFKPSFNALNMFRIPASHSVEYVTPFAGAMRYSITGWMRTGKPS